MTQYMLKTVPKASPNACGEWRKVDAPLLDGMCWLDLAIALDDQVPETHFIVAIERVRS